jgi:hypothetical protein
VGPIQDTLFPDVFFGIFLGMVSFFRNFIERFAEKPNPLYALLKKGWTSAA